MTTYASIRQLDAHAREVDLLRDIRRIAETGNLLPTMGWRRPNEEQAIVEFCRSCVKRLERR